MPEKSIRNWEIQFSGNLFQVERNERGWESANRPPGTRTIILSTDSSQILLTKEVRTEHDRQVDWRLPGGKVADSWSDFAPLVGNNEAIDRAARDGAVLEVRQEAGIEISSADLELIDVRRCGGKVTWDLWYFLANRWSEHSTGQDLEDDEEIEVEWVAVERVKDLILNDSFKEDRTAAVLLRFLSSLGVI